MRQGAKPVKPKAGAKSSVARKSAKEGSRVRDLEKRLAEGLEREKAKDRALTEALDWQTPTSDILRVISQSQTDVQSVFDAILASAARLLRADTGVLSRVGRGRSDRARRAQEHRRCWRRRPEGDLPAAPRIRNAARPGHS